MAERRHDDRGRFAELDAYRGIAALMVAVFHLCFYVGYRPATGRPFYDGTALAVVFDQLSGSVAWFFVLSGFLIFLPFARAAVEQRGARSVRTFLVRRAFRILPLYYFVYLFVWAVLFRGTREQWVDLFEHLTFTHVFDNTHFLWTVGPAWSLGVEVAFYLFVAAVGPLAYALCGHFDTPASRRASLCYGVCLLLIGSVAYKAWALYVAHISPDTLPVFAGPLAELDTLAMGMLLAVVATSGGGRLARYAGTSPAFLRLVGLGLLGVAVDLRLTTVGGRVYFHTLCGLAFLLVLASTVLVRRRSAWERLLSHPVLGFLGLVSYSLYLWHEFLGWVLLHFQLLTAGGASDFWPRLLAVVALAIGVAGVSYWLIERPALRARAFLARGRVAPVLMPPRTAPAPLGYTAGRLDEREAG